MQAFKINEGSVCGSSSFPGIDHPAVGFTEELSNSCIKCGRAITCSRGISYTSEYGSLHNKLENTQMVPA